MRPVTPLLPVSSSNVLSAQGHLDINWHTWSGASGLHFYRASAERWREFEGTTDRNWELAGFGYRWVHVRTADDAYDIWVPFWSIVMMFLIIPIYGLGRSLMRNGYNQCRTCGYDLTGNTSGTCPECGTPVPSKSEVIA